MQQIILGKPYKFVPPYFGRFWPTVAPYILPFYLRTVAGIESVELIGEDFLHRSLAEQRRIVLAPNHSRDSDPMLLGLLAKKINQPFHYMTNWHAFLTSKVQGWLIQRLGGFSVYREGTDRKALKTASDLLILGKRPLVIFPEGEVSRTNDFLSPFMRGLSVIVKLANRVVDKKIFSPKIVVHPIVIKYILSEKYDTEEWIDQTLLQIESHYDWKPGTSSFFRRITKIGRKLLAFKELQWLGCIQKGSLFSRADRLKEHLLADLEVKWHTCKINKCFMSRINSLRGAILRNILAKNSEEDLSKELKDLEKIDLTIRLSSYPSHYLRKYPSLENIVETVERLQEDVLNRVKTYSHWKAKVQVGQALEVKQDEQSTQNLTTQLQNRMQWMLDSL